MTDQPTDDTTEDVAPDAEGVETNDTTDEAPEMFPRKYVEELREENAKYRQRAGQADELSKRVHRLMVERTGRLADPEDLPFDETHLEDEDALAAAVDDLLARKPHLASRRVVGDVGQGVTDTGATDLAAILRRAAT